MTLKDLSDVCSRASMVLYLREKELLPNLDGSAYSCYPDDPEEPNYQEEEVNNFEVVWLSPKAPWRIDVRLMIPCTEGGE